VLGGAPAEGWTLAVQELARSGSIPADCAVVAIEASGERARLVLQTRDGRRAERCSTTRTSWCRRTRRRRQPGRRVVARLVTRRVQASSSTLRR
jgi:hypothetical protein